MKTIKILITLAAFIFLAFPLLAQDTTKPFYFPHKKGDMWQYFYDEYSPQYVDTLQNFTIFDSTDHRGLIYLRQHAQFINPTRPPLILKNNADYWLDTVNNYVWGPKDQSDSALIYILNAKKGEQWIVWNSDQIGGSDYLMARVTDKWNGILLNKGTTFIEVFYYFTKDTTDTTGYSVYGSDIIADGFGLIARGGGELIGEIHLLGAVINDTLYGDTTLTSIKNYKSPVPDSFNLSIPYPNPFNPSTTIVYQLRKESKVTIAVFNILGEKIKEIYNGIKPVGIYKTIFNASGLPSGVYLISLETPQGYKVQKSIYLK